jgi:hypothetical protein
MGAEIKESYSISLQPSDAQWLRLVGASCTPTRENNLAAGVELAKAAAEAFAKQHPKEWKALQAHMREARARYHAGSRW